MQQVEPGKYVFILPEPNRINHLVAFTTSPFDPGYGASLYYNSARKESSGAPWQFLGILTNDKPSAIFKVKQGNTDSMMVEGPSGDFGELGISIQPMAQLEALMAEKTMALSPYNPAIVDPRSSLQRLAESALNFLGSFANTAMAYGQEQVVPLRCLQDWYNTTLRKLASDPNYLNTRG